MLHKPEKKNWSHLATKAIYNLVNKKDSLVNKKKIGLLMKIDWSFSPNKANCVYRVFLIGFFDMGALHSFAIL